MKITFRTKMNVLFLVIMAVFMAISTWISFLVSKNVITRQMVATNESELSMGVETLEELVFKSKEKYRFFVDDFMLTFEGIPDVNPGILNDTFDFYPDLRTFLYTNREFKAMFLYQDNLLLGTSMKHEMIAFTERLMPGASEEAAVAFLMDNLKVNWRNGGEELSSGQLIVHEQGEGLYIAAVLDMQMLLALNDLKLSKHDDDGQVLFGGGEDPLLGMELPSEVGAAGTMETSVQNGGMVSVLESVSGERYALAKSEELLNESLNRIVVRLLGIGGVIYLSFAGLSMILTRRMLVPVYAFIDKLREVKGAEDRQPMRSYITTYEGHASVYRKIFMYYAMITIPVMTMIFISFQEFEGMIESNSRLDALNLFKATSHGIESEIDAYDAYLRYLTLNREFQDMMFSANRSGDVGEMSAAFSDLLMRKGVVDKRLNYIAIYDARSRLLYASGNSTGTNSGDAQRVWRDRVVKVVEDEERGHPLLTMTRSMKYLSNSTDKANAFEYLGDIEIGIEDVFGGKVGAASKATLLKESDGTVHLVERLASVPGIGRLASEFAADGREASSSDYIDAGGVQNVLTSIPIQEGAWTLGFIMPVSWSEQGYMLVLLYLLELMGMLCILIVLSNQLGRRMTAPIRRAIRFMEQYTEDRSVRLEGKERDFEFVVLAEKFNHMLMRLEDVSDELRTKEAENVEMDKRMNKLLLRALQAQINPHFLQNIFTSIMLLLKQGKSQEATEMLVATAKFLKSGLYGTKDLVKLEEEEEHVRNYVDIQSIRYDGQLVCKLTIDEPDKRKKVPKFILQPLVENAIHHAMRKDRLLTILISGWREGEDYLLTVEDDGLGMSEAALEEAIESMNNQFQTEHYGLSNVHERIGLEYGPGYGLLVESSKGEGTRITIRLGAGGEGLE